MDITPGPDHQLKQNIYPDSTTKSVKLAEDFIPLTDRLFITGLLMIALSASLFCVPLVSTFQTQSFMGFFFFHYLLSVSYLIMIAGPNLLFWKSNSKKIPLRYLIPSAVLFLISAYALNRDIVVFSPSVDWLSVFLVVQCVALLGLTYAERLPKKVLLSLIFALGSGFPLFVYLSLFVAPLYFLSSVGLLFLGISIHTFVPLALVLVTLAIVRKCGSITEKVRLTFMAGALLSVAVVAAFSLYWSHVNKNINHEYSRSLIEEQELPAWVRISQKMPRNFMSELALKGNLVYHIFNPDSDVSWGLGGTSYWEERKHDPLLVVATFFSQPNELGEKERIKILESLYDGRHYAEQRLWSGQNLRTTQVISNVKLWPEYRMAYTEKILSIKNTSARTTWLQTEEALYSFHLPEGSTISSLSLWIDNEEQKGYLTSKQVADSAYNTIVGREARDPSLVHWKEGNIVTVRIFPVTPAENRRFKIGITSPLTLRDGQLIYKNIYFDGPISEDATQTLVIDKGSGKNVSLPFNTTETNGGKLEYEGSYVHDWQLTMPVTPLASHSFSFQGATYQIKPYQPQLKKVSFSRIYLDLNTAWKGAEIEEIFEISEGKKIYAWNGARMVELSKGNLVQIQDQTSDLHYSLFPLQLVKDPDQSLLITKGTAISPNVSDLEGSQFYKKLVNPQVEKHPIMTYCLGYDELSPYLKSLREFRLIQLVQGDKEKLADLL
jgi:XrtN system VIT domain protein